MLKNSSPSCHSSTPPLAKEEFSPTHLIHEATGTMATTSTMSTSILNNITTKSIGLGGGVVGDYCIEPISYRTYLYCSDKTRGLVKVETNKDDRRNELEYWLIIDGEKVQLEFSNKFSFPKKLPFLTPTPESIAAFINNKLKIKTINEIFEDICKISRSFFDLEQEEYHIMNALGIIQSWLILILESTFLISRDGTKGSAKTTYAEYTASLCRHGLTLGDTSAAAIGRSIEQFQASLHVDELDNLKFDVREQIEGILRKSQRRDNPYTRVNPNTGEIEFFDVFGFHTFSYRGNTEDALKSRSYAIRTKPTTDYRLAIINKIRSKLIQPTYEQLFFWYMTNITKLRSQIMPENINLDEVLVKEKIESIRAKLWNNLVKGLTKEEVSLLKKLTGRNSELAYNILNICKILNLKIFPLVKRAIETKIELESTTDQIYLNILNECLRNIFEDAENKWTLSKGKFEGLRYYSRAQAYLKFIELLKAKGLPTTGDSKFYSLLKDVGFVEDYNIKKQKNPFSKQPERCLIFTKEIIIKLGLEIKNEI